MPPRRRHQPDPGPRGQARARLDDEAAGEHVVEQAAEQRHERHDERLAADRLINRELEDVEPDLTAEERIPMAERRGVEDAQPHQPVGGTRERDDEREQQRHRHRHAGKLTTLERNLAAVGARPEHDVRTLERPAASVAKIEVQEEEHGCERRAKHHGLRVQRPDKDALVSEFAKPEPVRVVPDGARHHEQQNGGQQHDARQAAQPHSDVLTVPDNLITRSGGVPEAQ